MIDAKPDRDRFQLITQAPPASDVPEPHALPAAEQHALSAAGARAGLAPEHVALLAHETFALEFGAHLLRGDFVAAPANRGAAEPRPARSSNAAVDHPESLGGVATAVRHALLLHGAGTSSRATFLRNGLRTALHARGVASTAFDCIGHGETGGALADSSVASRTRQAQAVVAARGLAQPLTIVGNSMGAYNAVKMCELVDVQALVLVVPGMYTPGAYEPPFGPRFSEAIRRPRSWDDSDAFAILARFKGELLVIAAEHDAVIPREIPERMVAVAGQARVRELVVVAGADHGRMSSMLLAERPAEFERLMDRIARCAR